MNAVAGLIIACLALTAYGLPGPQITGGNDTLDGAYPYQVSLRNDPVHGGSHFCGGAIISEHYIITCAKCIVGFLKNPYKVYVAVGSNYLVTDDAVIYQAINLIVHAGYNKLLRINDIGLIQTLNTITFNDKVQPIALPTVDRNFDGYPVLATGWGQLWLNGPIPNRLQEIILRGYSHELCSRYEHVKATHLCTFTMENEGACYGDGGGPLVANNELVGLMSYSYGPCGAGAPDVSTRVFSYRSWIKYYTGI
ncbi:chymotrypsin-2-like [Temnothorax nylanderi]|uniref:chymotrypsin-2-like n=1 Tax=Temnothorax nylanderi TaxID=102681 RepID=UPI003A84153F